MANQTANPPAAESKAAILPKPIPDDVLKWARQMGKRGHTVTPTVKETTDKAGSPYSFVAELPEIVTIPLLDERGSVKKNEYGEVLTEEVLVEDSWPILFGFPFYRPGPLADEAQEAKTPFSPLSSIAGVDVFYVGTLHAEGVGVYLRKGEYL